MTGNSADDPAAGAPGDDASAFGEPGTAPPAGVEPGAVDAGAVDAVGAAVADAGIAEARDRRRGDVDQGVDQGGRPGPARLTTVFWPAGQAAAALACWTASWVVPWLTGLATLGVLLALFEGFGLTAWWAPAARWSARAAALAAVVPAVRFAFPTGRPPGFDAAPHGAPVGSFALLAVALAVFGLLATQLLRARYHRWGQVVSAPLRLPFERGTWYVVQGGGPAINHHTVAAVQRGAVDIVALGRDGRRVTGRTPHGLGDHLAYGRALLSPCDGVVLAAVDGLPDEPVGQPAPWQAAGNHVRIDTGSEQVLLAHLRPGSVRVAAGDAVVTGQPLGEIGNSGNTTEPHLHLHAERDGLGLDLRFAGVPGPLYRGRRLRVRDR